VYFNLMQTEGQGSIQLYHNGEIFSAQQDHPNFDQIVEAALAHDPNVINLFERSRQVANYFKPLSERVTATRNEILFDGDPLAGELSDKILEFVDADEDPAVLVNFLEKLMQNPSEHSRENLYRWLQAESFTISAEGDIVAYKSVQDLGDGSYRSHSSGDAIVNGEPQSGRIKQRIGDVVTMPRSEVQFDSGVACSTGLHAGTWEYASTFGGVGSVILQVHINPRDVVSVPTDCRGQKMRTCRYTIVGIATQKLDYLVYRDVTKAEDVTEDFEDDWYTDEDYAEEAPF
jgi:hypothetical protein